MVQNFMELKNGFKTLRVDMTTRLTNKDKCKTRVKNCIIVKIHWMCFCFFYCIIEDVISWMLFLCVKNPIPVFIPRQNVRLS